MIKHLRINQTILLLTVNDVFTWGVYNAINVLVGIYLTEKLNMLATEVVGIGVGILFLTRSVVQIPMGLIGDRLHTERDEVIMLMWGNILMGLPIILLTQVTAAWHYYLLQIVFGIGAAMNLVDWRKLFAKNLDKGREGLQYAVYDSIMSLSIALIAVSGGVVANISEKYFDIVIAGVGLLICLSNIWIISIYSAQHQIFQKQAGQPGS